MNIFKSFTGLFIHLAKEMRLSYVPPLMIYFAAGISGFTGIIESFYVKDELGLSAEFLASLGFWAGIPWALKMPVGHMVDLFWRFKSGFIFVGAGLMASSILIMIGLTGNTEFMASMWSIENWYILASLISPVGYVLQDVVADAMTVEAVPLTDKNGNNLNEKQLRKMHVTMQTLGRMAIMLGIALVSGIGGWLAAVYSYNWMYTVSLVVPIISVCGVFVGFYMQRKKLNGLIKNGVNKKRIQQIMNFQQEKISANWWILGGSMLYVAFTISMGLSSTISYAQEIIFVGSMAIIALLIKNLIKDLSKEKQIALISMAIIIFSFRSMPSVGAGLTWWQIDILKFDEAFMGTLRQISAILAIIGMVILREWMQSKPVSYFMVFLTLIGTVLFIPYIGMFYGLHEWTMTNFGFGAHTIAIVDTMADAPFGQVAMIPMLAWIAMEAPRNMKATYFAVMAAFSNLALSASSLATKYLNQVFTITREVKNGDIITNADYSQLGALMITVAIIAFVIPLITVYLLRNKI